MKIEGLERWQHKQDIDPVPCPQCDNEDSQVLGALGLRVWIRCGACGWEYSYLIGEKKASDGTRFEDNL